MDVDLTPALALRERLIEHVIAQANGDFLTFVKLMAPQIVPDFKMGRHIEVLCAKLQEVLDGKCKRLMVFLPPRSTKSVICSKLFPAYYIGRNRRHEIISVSHGAELAQDFGRAVRDIIGTDVFQFVFPGVGIRPDVRAAGKWQTTSGGVYISAGVKTQIAGRGAHVAIIDDAMSEEDAFSAAGRNYIKEWWPSGLRSRLMPNGAIVIINTRYHEDDLCGWLLSKQPGQWDVVRIPAWLDKEAADLLGLPVNTSYFPEWKPDAMLKLDEMEIKQTNGNRYWQALYMQNPVPAEGGIVKKTQFKLWKGEAPPKCSLIVQTLDTAFSRQKRADFSVIQTWGIFQVPEKDAKGREYNANHGILIGSIKGRFEWPELRVEAIKAFERHKPDVMIIEKKASGQSLIQDLRRASLPVLEYTPDRDKESRVHAITPLLESGRVWVPDKAWAMDMIDEVCGFPNAAHDDQVDAMTMALSYLKEGWNLNSSTDERPFDDVKKPRRKTYWSAVTS